MFTIMIGNNHGHYMNVKSLAFPIVILVLTCLAFTSCDNMESSKNILNDFAQQVNNSKDNSNKFKVFNTSKYFAICYYVENTPENKARLLLLGNLQDLTSKFKENVLKNLDKGDALTQIVKEKKGLAYAICCGDLEYHVYFPPEELYSKFYKQ